MDETALFQEYSLLLKLNYPETLPKLHTTARSVFIGGGPVGRGALRTSSLPDTKNIVHASEKIEREGEEVVERGRREHVCGCGGVGGRRDDHGG